jgi:hypothetical protein
MKSFATVFVLLALVLVPCAPCMAQTPQAAPPSASSLKATAPAPVADFLETLSSGQSSAPATQDQMPSPKFLTTYCTSDDECPTGQLCCYPCGIDGCRNICMQPIKGECPLFV